MQRVNPYPRTASYDFSASISSHSSCTPQPTPLHKKPLEDDSSHLTKKRRKDRACDNCRRRKTKCDGPWTSDNICSNCSQANKQCTYLEVSKPRGPPKAYVTGLENRLESLEALLRKLKPDTDFSSILGPPVIRDSWKNVDSPTIASTSSEVGRYVRAPPPTPPPPILSSSNSRPSAANTHVSPKQRTTHLMFKPRTRERRECSGILFSDRYNSDNDSISSDDNASSTASDGVAESSIGERVRLALNATEPPGDFNLRFHGQSSAAGLVEVTRQFKTMRLREMEQLSETDSPRLPKTRRSEFWRTPRWELVYEGHHDDSPVLLPSVLEMFPPPDLCDALIDLYFLHSNSYFPLLHQPTFRRQWKEELHCHNLWYACVCLCLFAVASRWSDDPRVLPKNIKTESGEQLDWKMCGFSFYETGMDIHRMRRSLFYPATLFEVQSFTLMAMYLRGTASYPVAWLVTSVGIRKAQDLGAHRKNIYRDTPNLDDELWKRAFWHLIVFDRLGGSTLGRSGNAAEEDYDLDLPLEVDDEYWETGNPADDFKQPPGKPSRISAFVQFIKLSQIVAFAMKTVYAPDKSKVFWGLFRTDWREEAIRQLNTAMKEWLDEVPAHLQWKEGMDDFVFANQAATILTAYHWNEMLIYRPFIPSVGNASNQSSIRNSFPSPANSPLRALEICTNAARSCARVIRNRLKYGISNVPNLINVAQTSAGILILSFWDLKNQQRVKHSNKRGSSDSLLVGRMNDILSDISTCLELLEWAEKKWDFASAFLAKLKESMPSVDGESDYSPPPEYQRADWQPGRHFIPYSTDRQAEVGVPISAEEHDSVPFSEGERSRNYKPSANALHYLPPGNPEWPPDILHAGQRCSTRTRTLSVATPLSASRSVRDAHSLTRRTSYPTFSAVREEGFTCDDHSLSAGTKPYMQRLLSERIPGVEAGVVKTEDVSMSSYDDHSYPVAYAHCQSSNISQSSEWAGQNLGSSEVYDKRGARGMERAEDMLHGYQRPLWTWSGERNILNDFPDYWNRDGTPRRRPHYDHRYEGNPSYNEGAYRC